ncbi:MAG TPA: NAD(P)H-dependent oxidoreductase [Bacillota bacterium]|nr:NAD(P)H-dependent oxidoreductase [Bacillota bacterium]
MSGLRRALLLVGSPRRARSTSASLGGYLLARLAEHGVTGCTHFLEDLPPNAAYAVGAGSEPAPTSDRAVSAVGAADLLILSFPLYVDSAPAPVTRAMVAMAEARRRDGGAERAPGFVAIVNCGFPEAHHADVALAISRRFAAACRFRWLGGMAMGLGGMLGGRPLGQRDARLGHVEQALELAAAALAREEPVPESAVALLARPMVTPASFVPAGNRYWSAKAAARGLQDRLREQPYRR